MTARRADTSPPIGVFWAVSEIRRAIGDNGRATLDDLPAAVVAALDKAFSDGAEAALKAHADEYGGGGGSSYWTATQAARKVRRPA